MEPRHPRHPKPRTSLLDRMDNDWLIETRVGFVVCAFICLSIIATTEAGRALGTIGRAIYGKAR